jgi:hypothetical protein
MRNLDEEFISEVIPSDLLESVIAWIQENMNPRDVFEEETIFDWCKENVTDVEDVCPERLLDLWAENNGLGYVGEE